MSELVPSKIIEKLEQRHERLIEELDELNDRLEKALNSFTRTSDGNEKPETSSRSTQTLTSTPIALASSPQAENASAL